LDVNKVLLLIVTLIGFVVAPAFGTETDDSFLDELERRSFQFFWDEADLKTGLIPDRGDAEGNWHCDVASVATVGYGLTAICIADHRGWIRRDEAYDRVWTTLRTLLEKVPHEHGFFYHFLDAHTGARVWDCEASSIDTALLMNGVLTAREYFAGTDVDRLATEIYRRVDWPWMLNGGRTMSMGWTPEAGFLRYRWDNYSELMMLYLLGLGSRTHPLPPETWRAWQRGPTVTYAGRTYLNCPPLFAHQYSQAWFDFRNCRDEFADYWRNSVDATLAHRQYCVDQAKQFPKYNELTWGLTAADGPGGVYRAFGGPPGSPDLDGVVVPCAPGGSIPFAPIECVATLRGLHATYGATIWKKYGFVDAFNPHTGWVDTDVIGIDVGITLLMAENQRSGFVWKYFMQNPEMQRAMQLAGFRPLTAPAATLDKTAASR
jgi:hypothetical protein